MTGRSHPGDPTIGPQSITDSGPPRVIYNSARTIRLQLAGNGNVVLNGFRAGGHYMQASGSVYALDRASSASYDLDDADAHPGFGAPGIDAGSPEMWIAVFAARRAGESTATVNFVPYLLVTAYNSNTKTATFDALAGTMTTGAEWTGTDILACHEGGLFSWRTSTIASNTATTVTLSSSLSLAAGDYLLPAPPLGAEYKYLCSLKLDYAPGANEWRNFCFSGRDTNSTTGNPFGNITSTSDIELDMSGYVSPLATGWIAAIQAYRSSTTDGSQLYISHDQGSLHTIAQVGLDRTAVANAGVTSPARGAFGASQSIYARVNHADTVGRVNILGWSE